MVYRGKATPSGTALLLGGPLPPVQAQTQVPAQAQVPTQTQKVPVPSYQKSHPGHGHNHDNGCATSAHVGGTATANGNELFVPTYKYHASNLDLTTVTNGATPSGSPASSARSSPSSVPVPAGHYDANTRYYHANTNTSTNTRYYESTNTTINTNTRYDGGTTGGLRLGTNPNPNANANSHTNTHDNGGEEISYRLRPTPTTTIVPPGFDVDVDVGAEPAAAAGGADYDYFHRITDAFVPSAPLPPSASPPPTSAFVASRARSYPVRSASGTGLGNSNSSSLRRAQAAASGGAKVASTAKAPSARPHPRSSLARAAAGILTPYYGSGSGSRSSGAARAGNSASAGISSSSKPRVKTSKSSPKASPKASPKSSPRTSTSPTHNNTPPPKTKTPRSPSISAVSDPRFKTEICQNYLAGRCTFGSSCHFAHGLGELRTMTVSELIEAGVADATNSRVRPCLTFVSTGSCPFGPRCTSLHDPRVALSAPLCLECDTTGSDNQFKKNGAAAARPTSWLGHFEQPVSGMTDLIIANLHHQHTNMVNNGTPFGRFLLPTLKKLVVSMRLLQMSDDAAFGGSGASLSRAASQAGDAAMAWMAYSYGGGNTGRSTRSTIGAELQKEIRNHLNSLWEKFFEAIVTGKDLCSPKALEDDQGAAMNGGCGNNAGFGGRATSSIFEAWGDTNNGDSSGAAVTKKTTFSSFAAAAAAAVTADDIAAMPATTNGAGTKLTQLQRLKIVLDMAYTPKASWHIFQPNRTVFGEPAMIVQVQTYAVNIDGSIEKVEGDGSSLGRPTVVVYEVAFHTDGNPKASSGAALYFDLPSEAMAPYVPRPKKRGSVSSLAKSPAPSICGITMDAYVENAKNKPFYLTRPYDVDSMELVVGILQVKVSELTKAAENAKGALLESGGGSMGNLFGLFGGTDEVDKEKNPIATARETHQILEATKLGLYRRFKSLLWHWAALHLDRCAERADPSDENATVLHVNGDYNPQAHMAGTTSARPGEIWNSFVGTMNLDDSDFTIQGMQYESRSQKYQKSQKRLRLFADLGDSSNRYNGQFSSGPIPLLGKKSGNDNAFDDKYPSPDFKTRCWQSLLLANSGEGEWDDAMKAMKDKDNKKSSSRPSTPTTSKLQYSAPSTPVSGVGRSEAVLTPKSNGRRGSAPSRRVSPRGLPTVPEI